MTTGGSPTWLCWWRPVASTASAAGWWRVVASGRSVGGAWAAVSRQNRVGEWAVLPAGRGPPKAGDEVTEFAAVAVASVVLK